MTDLLSAEKQIASPCDWIGKTIARGFCELKTSTQDDSGSRRSYKWAFQIISNDQPVSVWGKRHPGYVSNGKVTDAIDFNGFFLCGPGGKLKYKHAGIAFSFVVDVSFFDQPNSGRQFVQIRWLRSLPHHQDIRS